MSFWSDVQIKPAKVSGTGNYPELLSMAAAAAAAGVGEKPKRPAANVPYPSVQPNTTAATVEGQGARATHPEARSQQRAAFSTAELRAPGRGWVRGSAIPQTV